MSTAHVVPPACSCSVLCGVSVMLEGGDVKGTSGVNQAFFPEAFRRVRGRGGVTYVLLEGCHKRLGCTLVRTAG